MEAFDLNILTWINSFAQRSYIIDKIIVFIEGSNLFKGGIIIPLLWWVWFSKIKAEKQKEFILSTIVASLIAVFVGKSLVLMLPLRLRPIHNPLTHFKVPYGVDVSVLDGWSSFPSDHAVFFFTLSTGLFLASKPLGFFALSYSFIVICLPRIYVGHHYPTDIVGGMLLGICIGYLVNNFAFRKLTTGYFLEWEQKHPPSFYAGLFIVNYQMILLFDPLRELLKASIALLHFLNLH